MTESNNFFQLVENQERRWICKGKPVKMLGEAGVQIKLEKKSLILTTTVGKPSAIFFLI